MDDSNIEPAGGRLGITPKQLGTLLGYAHPVAQIQSLFRQVSKNFAWDGEVVLSENKRSVVWLSISAAIRIAARCHRPDTQAVLDWLTALQHRKTSEP